MSTSTTLPSTIQIRPSRLAALLVAVAILTGVTTWSVSQVTTDSHAPSSSNAYLVSSPDPATQAYLEGLVALDAEPRAAIFGNLTPTRLYVQGVNALSPAQQAAIWGNVSPGDGRSFTTDAGGAGAFIAPAHANGVSGAGGPLAAIGGAGAFTPFGAPGS